MEALPRTQIDIDRYDVTLVVCMLSDVMGDDIDGFAEHSTVGNDLRELCEKLEKLRRPILITGATSDTWGLWIRMGCDGRQDGVDGPC